jgi:3-methylcrotonyl-CoA carboxylase alpha subunit
MFDTLLIANRGEIACRIIRTARRLGLRSVAVYSEADAEALHVRQADDARLLGPAPAAESYLDIAAVIEAARLSGAQAVHPGYGFLAENAAFAEACGAAGLIFVGPPPEAIRAMGSKSEAKTLMEQAGVPLVPGYHGDSRDLAVLERAARTVGYPVLIKASAGGGGKGMRVVEQAMDFDAAVGAARREAAAAFGDDRVLLEKYLTHPRHIEIQVFADGHGNALHLFERDCSIQRRHQKVLEEAPAPGLSPERRAEMGAAAVAAARAIGYVGAGTVEFIVEGDAFYFMEMNTRLQVEHPVTEMITGQDLVEWQLRIAAGAALPCGQDELAVRGHAIEARLYAEDPARGFLPATGRLVHLRFPETGPRVRVDSGVSAGDAVTVHYDPLLAKLVVWGEDRPAALRRLAAALAGTQAVGVTTNLAFLAAVAAHPAYIAGELDTGFIERRGAELMPPAGPASDEVLALASLAVLQRRRAEAEALARRCGDPHSPWHQTTGWRLNVETHGRLVFRDDDREVAVTVHYRPDGYRLELPGGEIAARGRLEANGDLRAELAGHHVRATVVRRDHELAVLMGAELHRLVLHDPLALGAAAEAGSGRLTAPMPGRVTEVHVKPGARVARGAPLLVLEAMKMEHTIAAPADGRVTEIHYDAGALVEEGAELLALDLEGA